jgi:hypothetical protein
LNFSLHKESLLSFERKYDKQIVQIWLNFSNRPIQIDEIQQRAELIFSTLRESTPLENTGIHLEPFQGIILETHYD